MSKSLVSMSDDELRKLASDNSSAWHNADKETQDALHDENLRINAILDQRNQTNTTYDPWTGTYSTEGTQKPKTDVPSPFYQSAPAPAQTQYVPQTEAPAAAEPKQEKSYGYDPASDAAYQQAIAALTQAGQNAPAYNPSYDAQLQDLYDQIVNRPAFQYDINSDMLYRQYAQQYADMGRLAMQDTMGQAAALTGGYGSSYAQAVGQQQYDAYLKQLNEVIPELYAQAYGQYQDEGDRLMQQYSMLGDRAKEEYGKYQDEYSRWANERDYAKSLADDAYQRGYNNYWQGVDQQNADRQFEYNRQNADREYQLALDQFNYNKENADRQFAYNQQNADREYQLALDKWNYQMQQDAEEKAVKEAAANQKVVYVPAKYENSAENVDISKNKTQNSNNQSSLTSSDIYEYIRNSYLEGGRQEAAAMLTQMAPYLTDAQLESLMIAYGI